MNYLQEKTQSANKLNKITLGSYREISCSLLKFASSLQNFPGSFKVDKPINFIEDPKHPDQSSSVVGASGTFENVLNIFDYTLLIFLENLSKSGETILKQSLDIEKEFNSNEEKFKINHIFKTNEDTIEQLQTLYEAISAIQNTKEISMIISKMMKMKQEIVQKPLNSQIIVRSYKKEIDSFLEARKRTASQRMRIIEEATSLSKDFESNIEKITVVTNQRLNSISTLFECVHSALTNFSNQIRETVSTLNQAINTLNFNSDFTSFVRKNKLIRYDLPCHDFTPLHLSSPIFEESHLELHASIPQIFPVAMGQIIENFTASKSTEFTVYKNHYILLMENMDLDWVYVMDPISFQKGFVPSWAIKQIPGKLCVVMRPLNHEELSSLNNVTLHIGDYLVILKMKEGEFTCQTTYGDIISIPPDVVGIVSN